jgi:PAS domain-containing protein
MRTSRFVLWPCGTRKSILLARAPEQAASAKESLVRKTQELAHSLDHARDLDSTWDGILVTDDDGRITGYNETYIKMWRIPIEIMRSGNHQRSLLLSSRQSGSFPIRRPRQRDLCHGPMRV